MVSLDLFNLSGRVAIIKGGARGIGFVIAKGLASYGAVIVIADINSDGAEEAKIVIRSLFFTLYHIVRVSVYACHRSSL